MAGAMEKILRGRKSPKRTILDEGILRRNKISVLTLDERWNSLFRDIERTPIIIRCEENLNNRIKEQAKLTAEQKDVRAEKKRLLKRIMELTPDAFDRESAAARDEIAECEAKVRALKEREPEIEERLFGMRGEIDEANRMLLENAVSYIYRCIKESRERAQELDARIQDLRGELRDAISEKERLSESSGEAYLSLHDLLGARQMEELDGSFRIDS
jgi:chromosome segregation ATPase